MEVFDSTAVKDHKNSLLQYELQKVSLCTKLVDLYN